MQGDQEKTFWMVWRKSTSSLVRKHETYHSAFEEAKRLATQSNDEFYVLQAISKTRQFIVQTVMLEGV